MKAIVQVLPLANNQRLTKWFKLLSVVGSGQIVVQGLSFISGILVVRLLSTNEYALYILATTMLTNMLVLADSGIKTSVMAHGGKVWLDKLLLGKVLATGFQLRTRFAIISLIIACPFIVYLLRLHGASWPVCISIIVTLIPALILTLSATLLEITPKLHQAITPLQSIQIFSSFFRTVILGLTLVFFPWAAVAILSSVIPQIWANKKLRDLSGLYAEKNQLPDPGIRKELFVMVKWLLPDSVYLCLSGQITIWLISIFGSTAGVAQIGALGRLAMILTIFNALFGSIVSPRFARLADERKMLLKRYLQIEVGMIALCVITVVTVYFFSSQLLWVLGETYSNLTSEIVFMMGASCIGLIAQSTFYLCTSKGWVINPIISIPLSIISIAIGAMIFDVSSLKGVFMLNLLSNIIMALTHFSYGFLRIIAIKQ